MLTWNAASDSFSLISNWIVELVSLNSWLRTADKIGPVFCLLLSETQNPMFQKWPFVRTIRFTGVSLSEWSVFFLDVGKAVIYVWSWCWEATSVLNVCCHPFERNQQRFPHLYLFGSSASTGALSFSHMPNVHFSNLSTAMVSARIALAHSPLSPCGWRPSLWAVIGQRDKAGEWPPLQWHCIISDRGHRVRGERGLPDTTKKQSSAASFLQSSPLSVKRSTLFMFAAKGVGSPQTEAERPLSLRVVFNNRNFFLEFYHVGKEFGTAVSHPLNKGMVEEAVFHDKWFSFLDPDVRETQCDLTSLSSDRQDTGNYSDLNKYFLVSLRFHYKSILEHLHHWAQCTCTVSLNFL